MAAPKGHDGQGGGRPKGSQNTKTLEIKQAFQNLLEMNTPNMIGWLQEVAAENPAKALDICGSLAEFVVPKLARQELTGPGGAPLTVSILKLGDNPEMLEKLRLQMQENNVKTIDHKRDDNCA